jgi:hypothetical protein
VSAIVLSIECSGLIVNPNCIRGPPADRTVRVG